MGVVGGEVCPVAGPALGQKGKEEADGVKQFHIKPNDVRVSKRVLGYVLKIIYSVPQTQAELR